jgi:hypothetical protein
LDPLDDKAVGIVDVGDPHVTPSRRRGAIAGRVHLRKPSFSPQALGDERFAVKQLTQPPALAAREAFVALSSPGGCARRVGAALSTAGAARYTAATG